jgi:hypothetical protein
MHASFANTVTVPTQPHACTTYLCLHACMHACMCVYTSATFPTFECAEHNVCVCVYMHTVPPPCLQHTGMICCIQLCKAWVCYLAAKFVRQLLSTWLRRSLTSRACLFYVSRWRIRLLENVGAPRVWWLHTWPSRLSARRAAADPACLPYLTP